LLFSSYRGAFLSPSINSKIPNLANVMLLTTVIFTVTILYIAKYFIDMCCESGLRTKLIL
jgi:hypothetical protein